MNLYSYKTISKLEIDCTSFCNAFCGACDRNIQGGEKNPNLKLSHLSISKWKKIVEDPLLGQINEIIFNGNFGDFSMHPDFIEMLDILASKKTDLYLNLNTNGAARNIQFWKDLAKVLRKFHKHDVKFGIDGLADTHDIYRRGLDWKKRIENLQNFNLSGGNSIWKCIVFDHNKHQIESMSQIAKELGCMAFQTNRNRTNPLSMKSYKGFIAQTLTSPSIKQFQEKYMIKKVFRQQVRTPITTSESPIGEPKCPYAQDGMIQIDPWGNVWPCCYISGRQISKRTNFDYHKYLNTNIDYDNLTNILNIFSKDLHQAWENKSIDLCNNCIGVSNPLPNY